MELIKYEKANCYIASSIDGYILRINDDAHALLESGKAVETAVVKN